ncbi:MAG: helix-turn-helix transcriptional regulator [Paludibacteraceae bacterium]|nr:helix-turn-helix transcriptional regulator [Paludibacteraceae bacterium]
MEIKRFKDIVVTNDLADLLDEQGKAHGRAYMWQCTRGQIRFEYAGVVYTMRREDLLFSPANRLPKILKQSRGYRGIIFALDGKKTEDILYACLREEPDWIDKLHFVLRHPMIHLSPRQVKLIDAYRQLVPLYADETGRYNRKVAFLQGQSIIYELLSLVEAEMNGEHLTPTLSQGEGASPLGRDGREVYGQTTSRKNEIYVAFLQLLEAQHATQRHVSWYAEQLRISPAYLNQVCRTMLGKSPQTMIQNTLLKESKQLLRTTELNIKQIAHQMGFSTEAAFCKYFRKQTGLTPSQFREKEM